MIGAKTRLFYRRMSRVPRHMTRHKPRHPVLSPVSSPVPPGAGHVDAVAANGHLLAPKCCELSLCDARCAGAIGTQHAMPGHLGAVPRHDHSHRTGRSHVDVLRHVAVGHDAASRDPVDRIEYALGEHGHLTGHAPQVTGTVRNMRILVIGGTSFVGRHMAQSAIDRGHDVTWFNRGKPNPDVLPQAERLTGDRNSDLSALDGRSWDATIDVCAYVPKQVRTLLESHGTRSGHVVFVSTISVFPDETPELYTEDSPLREPAWDDELVMEKYGELKVACEQVAQELAADRLLTIRPGYVVGPYDPTHRFTYWVERVAGGRSPMATPDPAQPLQCADARDLAAFTISRLEAGDVTAYNATAPTPAPTFGQVLEAVARGVGQSLPELRAVGYDDGLPLSAPPEDWSLMRADLSRPVAAGLAWRQLEQTVADTLDWVSRARADGRYTPREGVGVSAAEEASLLAGR